MIAVCGTTGKRKACKDCSCGLAEELANENRPAGPPAGKSSCGSVSLGHILFCILIIESEEVKIKIVIFR